MLVLLIHTDCFQVVWKKPLLFAKYFIVLTYSDFILGVVNSYPEEEKANGRNKLDENWFIGI